ncbi:MAG: hypothetical protein ISR58_03935 [Anaerolineales bacterium]|nr:hypothetical protein [Chloroflexota bacterium]MBL6980322.1 hypothetical protein [Anaerolineales bacterium]
MRRFLSALLTIAICLGISNPARGQTEIQIADPEVTYTFGGMLTIETEINSEVSIQRVLVLLQPAGETENVAAVATFTPPNQVTYSLDLSQNPFPVFTDVYYTFQVELENGETITSEKFKFDYDDDRFPWQSLQTEEFEVYWYEGDTEFGQTILNTAYEGLARLQNQVNVPNPDKVTFYVYASTQDLQSTLQMSGQAAAWIAGHANPAAGVVLVSIPPGPAQSIEIKRQVPHELTHVMLYLKLGEDYDKLPNWLHEGLASTTEVFPNPDYPLLLEKAYEREMLIPIANLCQSFPVDAANFQLAYAESTSFTWYLLGEFGNPGMENLIEAYADGVGCDRGVELALESSLAGLERDWRRLNFNESPLRSSTEGIIPWVIVFVTMLLPTFGLFVGDTIKHRRKNEKLQNAKGD